MESWLSNLRLTVHVAEYNRLTRAWRAADYRQPYARLYAIAGGAGTVHHHDRAYALRPGWLYLIPPHTPMSYRCDSYLDIHWVHFNARVHGGLDLFDYLTCDHELPAADFAFVARQLTRLRTVRAQGGEPAALEATGIMAQLLAPFVATADAAGLQLRREEVLRFQPVLEYLDQHLAEPLRVPALARLVHLEPTYFTTLFRRCFGMPPLRYLHHRRVERALGLLWSSDAKLARIAATLGYSDAFHFSRTFKAITGHAPHAFRGQRQRTLP